MFEALSFSGACAIEASALPAARERWDRFAAAVARGDVAPASAAVQVTGGVAVIPLAGVLVKPDHPLLAAYGFASLDAFAQQVEGVAAAPGVTAILIEIDSPGGGVDGVAMAADAVRAAVAVKPVMVLATGTMASAAYWIGAQAGPGRVLIDSPTSIVGSIGVVATHVDVSGAAAQRGIKVTEITAGAYKRAASPHAPLSVDGRAVLQDEVDYLYGLFVDAVASARRVSAQTVLRNMADGRVFIGQQAVTAGLVDGVTTRPQILDRLLGIRAAVPAEARGRATPPEVCIPAAPAEVRRQVAPAEARRLAEMSVSEMAATIQQPEAAIHRRVAAAAAAGRPITPAEAAVALIKGAAQPVAEMSSTEWAAAIRQRMNESAAAGKPITLTQAATQVRLILGASASASSQQGEIHTQVAAIQGHIGAAKAAGKVISPAQAALRTHLH